MDRSSRGGSKANVGRLAEVSRSAIENRIRTEEGTSARRITPEAGTRP